MALFQVGETVIDVYSLKKGVVSKVFPPSRVGQYYHVNFGGQIETMREGDLQKDYNIENPFERVRNNIYGNRDEFVLVNTTHKINNSNNNTISSLKASKTLFKAYQFKPLLKFLNSESRRILIADEVGLGKTIEAGHILLELKARDEFKTALIICPNSLKLKWQTELKEKFGLNFQIYESLKDAIEDLKGHPQNARGILNYEKIRVKRTNSPQKANEDSVSNELIDFLNTSQRKYSIVLCDEAHKVRNNETQTYRGLSKILDYASAVIFLTATPIMLGEDDLYNLLHLLEPHNYNNKEVFRNIISENAPFVKATSLLNSNAPLSDIKDLLRGDTIEEKYQIADEIYLTPQRLDEIYKDDVLYNKIIKLLDGPDSAQLRAQIQDSLSSISAINNIFSRTRKRDVSTDERQQTERNAHKTVIHLNKDEQLMYDNIINTYMEENSIDEYDSGEEKLQKGAVLGLIQKKRMIASSVHGYRLLTECNCNMQTFCQKVEQENELSDSKVSKLIEIFKGIENAGYNKVIVFSIFKFTVGYLEIRLRAKGIKIFAIHGDIKERENIISEFKKCTTFCVLLSTEVGSEGLDMQFCSHLVNYDLPWNPMVVEQRIGRIDRFGQKAATVHIYNLVVANSIQELIYDRLLERIGIFKGVIGDLEMILEEMDNSENGQNAFKRLEHDLYGTDLTMEEKERKIRDIEKAIEKQKIELDKVEDGLTNTLTNDIYFKNEISKIRHHKLYVTEEELINYIKLLIQKKLTTCQFEKNGDSTFSIIVPKSTPKIVSNFLAENQPFGEDYDSLFIPYRHNLYGDFAENKEHIITFNQEYAFENKDVDFVNIYNPIIVASSLFFKDQISSIGKTFQLKLKNNDDINIPNGNYFLATYALTTTRFILGKQVQSDTLIPVIYNVSTNTIITDEDLNMNVFGCVQEKSELLSLKERGFKISSEHCDNMEMKFTEYVSELRDRKSAEIAIVDNSHRETQKRHINKYYDIRINRENDNIRSAKFYVEATEGFPENSKAQNNLRLAKNRLKMIINERDIALENINSRKKPTIDLSIISLTQLLIY